jgi:hypothetical protein
VGASCGGCDRTPWPRKPLLYVQQGPFCARQAAKSWFWVGGPRAGRCCCGAPGLLLRPHHDDTRECRAGWAGRSDGEGRGLPMLCSTAARPWPERKNATQELLQVWLRWMRQVGPARRQQPVPVAAGLRPLASLDDDQCASGAAPPAPALTTCCGFIGPLVGDGLRERMCWHTVALPVHACQGS